MAAEGAAAAPAELFHVSLNPAGAETIVLLHGLGSSHHEWDGIAAALAQRHHVVAVDLPGHGASPGTFTLAAAAAGVAALLQPHAPCHLVGLSAGGFTALALAAAHPELVRSVFATGVYDLRPRRRLVALVPYPHLGTTWLQTTLPRALVDRVTRRFGLAFSPALTADLARNNSLALMRSGFASILDFGAGRPVAARACLVAAAKQDDVPGTKQLAAVLGSDSQVFVVREALHWWSLQFPDLFAAAVAAWVRGEDLPKDLIPIDDYA